ncbi:MAG: hypothetical protein RSE56_03500 [Bacilli bacterium]
MNKKELIIKKTNKEIAGYILLIIAPILSLVSLFLPVFTIASGDKTVYFYSIMNLYANETMRLFGTTFIVLNCLLVPLLILSIVLFITSSKLYAKYISLIITIIILAITVFIAFAVNFTIYGSIATISLILVSLSFIIFYLKDNKAMTEKEEKDEEIDTKSL